MKKLLQLLGVTLVLYTGFSIAHPSHDKLQTINKEQAIISATQQIKELVDAGTLKKSWVLAKVSKTVFERRDSRLTWNVSFDNTEVADEKQKILYIYLTNTGYYISSDFTGE